MAERVIPMGQPLQICGGRRRATRLAERLANPLRRLPIGGIVEHGQDRRPQLLGTGLLEVDPDLAHNEELAYGLRSIAVPVRARSGEVEAAINLAVHRTMVSMDDLTARLGPALERTAAEISARAGYRDGADA